jgi:hypothetical protein
LLRFFLRETNLLVRGQGKGRSAFLLARGASLIIKAKFGATRLILRNQRPSAKAG